MLTGRVPTQVKGKKVSALVDGTIPYPIDVIDLKNYLLDGGVFYFVVLLSPTGKKIYYSILLPYDINEILLKLAESQKSVSVHFDEFPNDKTEITDLFLNFLRDRDFQRSLSVIRKDEFNLLMKNGQFKEYKLGFTTSQKNLKSCHEYLFRHKLYLYVEMSCGIMVPVKKANGIDSTTSTCNTPIFCGGKQYYNSYREVKKKTHREFHFGQGVNFIFDEAKSNIKINYKVNGGLCQQIIDLEFFISIVENRIISFGTQEIPIGSCNDEMSFDLLDLKKELRFFKKTKKALVLAGCNVDLDLRSVTESDNEQIILLQKAFIDDLAIRMNSPGTAGVCKIKIANVSVFLMGKNVNGNYYHLKNLFDVDTHFLFESDNKTKINSCLLCLLGKEDFLCASNVNYDVIFKQVTSISFSETYHTHVNKLILNMLLAYDEGASEKKQLIDCVISLAKWLYDRTGNTVDLLNYLQAIKRYRAITTAELDDLHGLIENTNMTDATLTGIYILLDDYAGATLHYEKLLPDEQKQFLAYPICNLMKELRFSPESGQLE